MTETSLISTPLDTDHTRRPDAFGRATFAERLAHALVRTPEDDAIVIGLEGEWGSGKTHLLGQVQAKLKEVHAEAIIVEFNPWLVANTESLVLALLGQLAARIGTSAGNDRGDQGRRGLAASRRLLGYLSALQRVAEPALLLFDPTGTASGLAAVARKPLDTMSKALDDIALPNRLAKADVFARKAAVTEALRDFGHPIVVIVDDLDRLQDDELRSIFQAIKAVADFPGTSYLLAYDPKRVAKAFDDEHFVEKIVQVAYPIPHLHAWDMARFAKHEIKATLLALGCDDAQTTTEQFDKATWIAARLCCHPRHVVRLCNRLRIAAPAILRSIAPADIVVAEALAQVCPSIADAIRNHPTDFASHPHPYDGEEANNDWAQYLTQCESDESDTPRWEQHIPKDVLDKKTLTKALDFLFGTPSTAAVLSNSHDRRLRVPELLAEYLQLSPVEGIPSPGAIHDMLSSPQQLSDSIEDAGNDVATSLLDWVTKYFPQQPLPNPELILDQFLALAKKANLSEPARASNLVGQIAHFLIKSSSQDVRPQLMRRLIAGPSLCMSVMAVVEMAKEHGKILVDDPEDFLLPEDQRFIADVSEASALIELWRNKLREAVRQDVLTDEPYFNHLLRRWHQLGDPPYTELWQLTRNLCQTEEGLERFVRGFTDSSSKWTFPQSRNSFLELVWDRDDLIAKLDHARFGSDFTKLRDYLNSDDARKRHDALRKDSELAESIPSAQKQ